MAGTAAARSLSPLAVDWQPGLAWPQPWRWWSAAFVHYSASHLAANLLATAVVAAYGWAARLPTRSAWAWLAAWPVSHLALLGQPDLPHYGGLSGVLHAGVAVANVHLVVRGNRTERWVGVLGSVLLVTKVVLEAPWRAAVQHPPEWDIPIAPVAHLTGLLAGIACAALGEWLAGRRGPAEPD